MDGFISFQSKDVDVDIDLTANSKPNNYQKPSNEGQHNEKQDNLDTEQLDTISLLFSSSNKRLL